MTSVCLESSVGLDYVEASTYRKASSEKESTSSEFTEQCST